MLVSKNLKMELKNTAANILNSFKFWDTKISSNELFNSLQEKGTFHFVHKMEFFIGTFKDILDTLSEKFGNDNELGIELIDHAKEDGDHWKWYLQDLKELEKRSHSDGLMTRYELWGEETQVTRINSFKIMHIAMSAKTPFEAMLIIESLEFAFKVFIENYLEQLKNSFVYDHLIYLGEHHITEELNHSHESWHSLKVESFFEIVKKFKDLYEINNLDIERIEKIPGKILNLFDQMFSEWVDSEYA